MKKVNLLKTSFLALLMMAVSCEEKPKDQVVETPINEVEEEQTMEAEEAEATISWPIPDDEGVNAPTTAHQVKYCGPAGTNPFIVTYMGGGPGEAGKVFFEMTESEDENKVLRTFTGTLADDGTFTVKKPADCSDCADDYSTKKFKFNGSNSGMSSLLVMVNGELVEFDECML